MTQPEKEFKLTVGGFYALRGIEKVEYVAPAISPGWVALKTDDGKILLDKIDALTEWNPDPKPKSFESEREDIANDIIVLAENGRTSKDAVYMSMAKVRDIAARIRALQPDAPAAAVAGSADTERLDWLATMYVRVRLPLMYGSKELFDGLPRSQFDDELAPPWDIRTAIDKTRNSLEPPPIEPPSPPQPNPVAFDEAQEAAVVFGSRQCGMEWTITCSADKSLRSGTKLYTIPPAVSAPFDEAAERKLFEKAHPDLDLAWNDWVEFYFNVQTDRLWQSWLASAKVQRAAVFTC